jgi:hypothetical protein
MLVLLLLVIVLVYGSPSTVVSVPQHVHVVLVGFEQRGLALSSSRITALLLQLMPSRRPAALNTKRLLPIVFNLFYNVTSLSAEQARLSLLHDAMATSAAQQTRWRTIDGTFHIDAAVLERYVNETLLPIVPAVAPGAAIVVVLCTSAQRVYSALPETVRNAVIGGFSQFHYGYAPLNGSSAIDDAPPSHTWLSQDAWIAVDVSAVSLGSTLSSRATVTPPATLSTHAGEPEALSCVVRAVVSAVRTAIVPDMAFANVEFQLPAVVVPLIVLEESGASAAPLNVTALQAALSAILAPRTVYLAHTRHKLHDHALFMQALRDARQQRAHHVRAPDTGQFLPIQETYIDGAMLRREVRNVYDVLGAGLWRTELGAQVRAEKLFADGVREAVEAVAATGTQIGNTRIFPIYLFSTQRLVDTNAFFDDAVSWPTLSGDKDLCLVLQTPQVFAPLGVLTNGFTVTFDMRAAEGAIAACVAHGIDGVAPPNLFYSSVHDAVQVDTEWSTGHHPFALGAAPGAWSKRLTWLAERNHLMALATEAIDLLAKGETMLQDFVDEFVVNEWGDATSFTVQKKEHPLLWFLEAESEQVHTLEEEIFSHLVVEELRVIAANARDQLQLFRRSFTFHDGAEAAVLQLHLHATQMIERVERRIEEARDRLRCCELKFHQ